jgi:hypothetical protein
MATSAWCRCLWSALTTGLVAATGTAAAAQLDSPKLFNFVRTVQVTPNETFQTGSFARISYLPPSDRFLVTFGDKHRGPSGECIGAGYGFMELTLDLQPTDRAGHLLWVEDACDANDSGALMVGNEYYFVWVPSDQPGFYGWRVLKLDAISWATLADASLSLTDPQERSNDPTVALVNGLVDISSQYDASGIPPPLDEGAATHHTVVSPVLTVEERRVLDDVPHICGASLLQVGGVTHFVTADAFLGDLIVMKYDSAWNYLGMRHLREDAHWSTGLVFDSHRFYLAYMDTSQRAGPVDLPVYLNVRLAAFDRDWNLLEDQAVTSFTPSDHRQPGRPWLMLHETKLYVSYDVDTVDPVTHQEQLQWQAFVSCYELSPAPRRVRGRIAP